MKIPTSFGAGVLAIVLCAAAPAARQTPPPPPPAGQPSQQPPAQQPPSQQPPAQQPAQQQPQPERAQQPIRSSINFVRVDVIVSDKQGSPVLDMKPDEFTVAEDGKPQKIESFSVIKIDPTSQVDAEAPREIRSDTDEEREAARPDVRLFVILLDDYHVRRGNDMVVRKPLIDFIQNQLAPADMVALMYPLTPVTDLRFSRNRASLVSAIEKFEGRKFNYEPRNQFEEQYAYYPAATVERIRNDVTMGALKGAAVKLGGLREGRKSIIFVSEGFTATLPPQLNDPVAAMPGLGNSARRNPNIQNSDTTEFFNSASLLSDMREVFDTANRQNTSIYAVDPRGLAVFEYGINEGVGLQSDQKGLQASLDTLRVLADNTDGRAIVNRNDLAGGMKQIIRDASGYYLIGYSSTQAPTDGKFHEIKVRVTRKGVDVRARKGYWAYTTEDVARATAPPKPDAPSAVTAALNSIVEPSRGRPARFWVGTARADGGKSHITFTWEPTPPDAQLDRRSDADVPARVALTATSLDGRPLFRGRVPEEGTDASATAAAATSSSAAGSSGGATTPSTASPSSTAAKPPGAATPAGASTTFDAPPGQLQLRIVVENSRGQVMDSTTRDLTVPDFTKVEASFSTPRVYRARTVREIQAIKSNPNMPPTAERTFSRAERIFIRIEGYAPGGTAPTITARLLNRAGQSMSDLPIQTPSPGVAEVEMPLGTLGAGDYLIEFTGKTPSGTAQELVAFKVSR
jgi:VWFA-related protein